MRQREPRQRTHRRSPYVASLAMHPSRPEHSHVFHTEAQSYNAANCGRQVRVTNTQNGRSVVATIADRCPTCQNNPNSLDLSQGAFDAIADEAQGVVPIEYTYVS